MASAAGSLPVWSDVGSTERSTWRRDAPSVRSVANSRVRCATVIDRVLKITNEPNLIRSATAPETIVAAVPANTSWKKNFASSGIPVQLMAE